MILVYFAVVAVVGIALGVLIDQAVHSSHVAGNLIEERNFEYREVRDPVTGERKTETTELENPLYFMELKPEWVKRIHKEKEIRLKVIPMD